MGVLPPDIMSDAPLEGPASPAERSLIPAPAAPAAPYRVLARVYRPQRLSELIGQEVLVRSLTNAIRTGRIAHAFLLTGIRGVGKTTTARIVARALNCIGADGQGGPTPEPCGACRHCTAIAEDRHIDVLEMDAATRTGIDDIRDIVDGVRYAPTAARYKVYIIDEVHMLSEKAFNALLKTLEEPPPQAKFVFATTEVRKVPVTILSRCQRFDLRRVDMDLLVRHLAGIATKEAVEIEPAALDLIARAAAGSVRDALSLLDQAIALAGSDARSAIGTDLVHDMLGLADRSRLLDLFEHVMRGDVPAALALLGELHDLGSEAEAILQDLLGISHWLTRIKVTPQEAPSLAIAEADSDRAQALAAELSLPVLARTWQMLLKGLDELRLAPDPLRAAEMLLVRLAYAADLPAPAELAQAVGGQGGGSPGPQRDRAPEEMAEARPAAADLQPVASAPASPGSFEEAVALFRERNQPMLYNWLHSQAGLVRFEPGRLELNVNGHASAEWPRRVAECLSRWTDRSWQVSLSEATGAPPMAEQTAARKRARIDELATDPRVKPILESFPGARIVDVRSSRPPSSVEPSAAAERS